MMFKRLHKWFAIIVFIQLIIWLISGFLLGKLDHSLAAGQSTKHSSPINQIYNLSALVPIKEVLQRFPSTLEVELTYLIDKPVYRLIQRKQHHRYQQADIILVDGLSGAPLLLNKDDAVAIGLASYLGPARLQDAVLLQPPIAELPRERNPAWQIRLIDEDNTHIYVRSTDARVISHVNDETRWRDLLLMLHFMDYSQTGSFNTLLIQFFAVATLLLSGTGVWWGVRLIIENQVRFSWFSSVHTIDVTLLNEQDERKIKVKKDDSILSALSENDIHIASMCGGGGVCGRCRILASQQTVILSADRQHLSESDLQQGCRLACQHRTGEVRDIAVHTVASI